MYQALYRKWRPMRFADVIGQQHITDTLRAQVRSGRLSHAYLFTGTRGTGKTTCAKILARAVNCEHPVNGDPCNECPSCLGILDGSVLDVSEIDAASNNGVDNIRDLRDETRYTPAQVKKRVFIIDEVHMLSIGAFNALLKTLEEPPEHVLFILATTELNKVPATILSRCQRFDFRRIGADDIARRLSYVAEQEHIGLTEGAAQKIARLADGAMRDALSMLDRAAAEGDVDEQTVSQALGILGQDDAMQLAGKIKARDLAGTVQLLEEYYRMGRDLAGVYDQLLGLIRDALLIKTAKDASAVSAILSPVYSVSALQSLCEGLAASTLIAWTRIISDTLTRMRLASDRRIEAELCAVRLCELSADSYDSLGGRVEALEEQMKNGAVIASPAPRADAASNEKIKTGAPEKKALAAPSAEAGQQEKLEDTPAQQEPENAEEKPQEPETPKYSEWPLWPKLLQALAGKINTGTLTNMKLSAHGVLEEDKLIILCDDAATEMLAKMPATLQVLRAQAEQINGAPITVRVRPVDEAGTGKNETVEDLLQRAQEFDIKITRQ